MSGLIKKVPGWAYCLFVWVILYGPRPFVLGFYHDDWSVLVAQTWQTTAFSPERIQWFRDIYTNRPVAGLVDFLALCVCGASAFRWQCVAALMCLVTALALRKLFRAILVACNLNIPEAADWGAILWLVLPWTLGTTAWPLSSITLVATVFFAYSGILFFQAVRSPEFSWKMPGICFLLSGLTYEIYYGQFLVWFLVGYFVIPRGGVSRYLKAAAGIVSAQTLAVAWNRLAPVLSQVAPFKTLDASWFWLFKDNILKLPRCLASTMRISTWFPAQAFVVFVLIGFSILAIVIVYDVVDGNRLRSRWKSLVLLASCAFGIGCAVLLLSAASYELTGVGLFSRTVAHLSLWICLGCTVGLALLAAHGGACRFAAIVFSLIAVFWLATAQGLRVRDWAEVWRLEQDVLTRAPVQKLAQMSTNAAVLYIGPFIHNGVTVFGSTWDLDAAMKSSHLEVRHGRFYPAPPWWTTYWDGQVLEQRNPGPVLRTQCAELWVWNVYSNSVARVMPPLQWPVSP